jgi:hypothetical protein
MPSSDGEGQPPPRKRSRKASAGDDGGADGKKTRGRPRVDTKDATAADVSTRLLSPELCVKSRSGTVELMPPSADERRSGSHSGHIDSAKRQQ